MQKLFLLIFPILIGCQNLVRDENQDDGYDKELVPYDLLHPEDKLLMPNTLEEISGLALYDEQSMVGVDDEHGTIHFFNKNGEVINSIEFDDGDDYEGVAVAGDNIWITKSTGSLFSISESGAIEKFKTSLKRKNNVEGLAFDKSGHRLLIACKGDGGINKKIEGKAVYEYDLGTKKVSSDPVLVILISQLDKFIKQRNKELEVTSFEPSGIAIEPGTGHLYIISHQDKTLAVFDEQYSLKEVLKLSHNVFKQPEGICFDTKGNLYISNEGRGGRANVLVFRPLRK